MWRKTIKSLCFLFTKSQNIFKKPIKTFFLKSNKKIKTWTKQIVLYLVYSTFCTCDTRLLHYSTHGYCEKENIWQDDEQNAEIYHKSIKISWNRLPSDVKILIFFDVFLFSFQFSFSSSSTTGLCYLWKMLRYRHLILVFVMKCQTNNYNEANEATHSQINQDVVR